MSKKHRLCRNRSPTAAILDSSLTLMLSLGVFMDAWKRYLPTGGEAGDALYLLAHVGFQGRNLAFVSNIPKSLRFSVKCIWAATELKMM
jgi:hypothetical protein